MRACGTRVRGDCEWRALVGRTRTRRTVPAPELVTWHPFRVLSALEGAWSLRWLWRHRHGGCASLLAKMFRTSLWNMQKEHCKFFVRMAGVFYLSRLSLLLANKTLKSFLEVVYGHEFGRYVDSMKAGYARPVCPEQRRGSRPAQSVSFERSFSYPFMQALLLTRTQRGYLK